MIKTILFLLLSASKSKNWISYGQVKIVSRTTPPHFTLLFPAGTGFISYV